MQIVATGGGFEVRLTYTYADELTAGTFALKVAAFGNDAAAYRRYAFAEALPEDFAVRLVQQGTGTLWTDLQGTTGMDDVMRAKILKQK